MYDNYNIKLLILIKIITNLYIMSNKFNIEGNIEQLQNETKECNQIINKSKNEFNILEFKKEIKKQSIIYSIIFALITSVLANFIYDFIIK